jgi:hypothetical protein
MYSRIKIAGFVGWTLVQDYHAGVRLSREQEVGAPAVQHCQVIRCGAATPGEGGHPDPLRRPTTGVRRFNAVAWW